MCTLGHKPGCLLQGGPEKAHRVPIDCVTFAEMYQQACELREKINDLESENIKLKAMLWDIEHTGRT